MQLDVKTLSEYRFARAKEDMEATVSNHRSGFYKVAINRSYYAIFHAIRAVNILGGFDASKHSSVIAHFNQVYVHGGKFDRGTYKLIDSAYRIREKCDYSDFFIASKEDSENQICNAKEFLNRVENFLQAEGKMKCYRDREPFAFHAGGFYFVKNIVVIIDWSCVYISFLLQ